MIHSIGAHKVQHGDMLDGVADLMGAEKCSLLYCDPPWGAGTMQYFRTLDRKQNGSAGVEGKTTPPFDFLLALMHVFKQYGDGVALIEYGVRWEGLVRRAAHAVGLHHNGIAHPVYGKPARPLHLHVVSHANLYLPKSYFDALQGTSGYTTVLTAGQPFAVAGGILLDPCCGLGYSARLALDTQMRFRGNELNAARLNKTIDLLKERVL